MTTPAFEVFLAQLYTDEEVRRRFLANPRATAADAGLSAIECDELARIDRTDLELAALSLTHKRQQQGGKRGRPWWRWFRVPRGTIR